MQDKATLLKKIATRYLAGESLAKLAKKHEFNYPTLIRNLTRAADDKWTVNFRDETITYEIPRLLSKDLVQSVKDRIEHRHIAHRPDAQYALTGFVRCGGCQKNLISMKTPEEATNSFPITGIILEAEKKPVKEIAKSSGVSICLSWNG